MLVKRVSEKSGWSDGQPPTTLHIWNMDEWKEPPSHWNARQGSNERNQKIPFPGHKDKLVPWGGPGIWIIQEKEHQLKTSIINNTTYEKE